jgi:tripartite-type tricarboxylate transporter receptor subunit TctC
MQIPRRQFLRIAAAAAAAPVFAQRASALDYPTRPVRIVVPFGPGGPTDIFARLAAQKLSEQLGKQFYVENIGGGGGNIGSAQVARAAPDGHTILFTVSAFVTNPASSARRLTTPSRTSRRSRFRLPQRSRSSSIPPFRRGP